MQAMQDIHASYQLPYRLTVLLTYITLNIFVFLYMLCFPFSAYFILSGQNLISLRASFANCKPHFQDHMLCEAWRDFTEKSSEALLAGS